MLYEDPNVITGAQVIIILGIILLGIILPLIPADIAKKKGYSFGGFYAFGFFFFIPALIVALLMENKVERELFLDTRPVKVVYKEKEEESRQYFALIRNCYIHLPLRPVKVVIHEKDDYLWGNIYLKTYGEEIDGFLCHLQLFDLYNRLIFSKDVAARKLQRRAGLLVADNIRLGRVEEIDYEQLAGAEVYISHLEKNGQAIEVTDTCKAAYPVPLNQLTQLKEQYGVDAISFPKEIEEGWICRCGAICEKGKLCPICGKDFSSQKETKVDPMVIEGHIQAANRLEEIKKILTESENILKPETYSACMSYLNNLVSIDFMYHGNGKIADKEKERLLALFRR